MKTNEFAIKRKKVAESVKPVEQPKVVKPEDLTMPEFVFESADRQYQRTLSEQQVDMKGKKCTTCKKGTYEETDIHDNMHGELHCTKCNTVIKSRQPAKSKKKNVSEGIMDVVKQTFNDCVVGYPQGTSEGQFIQGWARAIRAETGRDIPAEKLTKLYHDYTERSPEIMQSHGTMDEGKKWTPPPSDYDQAKFVQLIQGYTPKSHIGREIQQRFSSTDYLLDESDELVGLIEEYFYEGLANGSEGPALPDERADIRAFRKAVKMSKTPGVTEGSAGAAAKPGVAEQQVGEAGGSFTAAGHYNNMIFQQNLNNLGQQLSQLSPADLEQFNQIAASVGIGSVAGVAGVIGAVTFGDMFMSVMRRTMGAAKKKVSVDTEEIIKLRRQIVSIHKRLATLKTEPAIAKYQAMLKQAYEVLEELEARQGNRVAEGTGDIGSKIADLCQKIYDLGDDAFDHVYHNAPTFAKAWNKYEGDLDSIIQEVSPKALQRIYNELVPLAQEEGILEQGVAEAGPGDINRLEHRGEEYNVYFNQRKGMYTARGTGQMKGQIQFEWFHTLADAIDHAEMEIGGYDEHDGVAEGLKEDATGGSTGSSSVSAVVTELGAGGMTKQQLRKRQADYTNVRKTGGPVKVKRNG